MKLSFQLKVGAIAILLTKINAVFAQGAFVNLDFEDTSILQNQSPGFVDATEAFPGWSIYYGTNQQTFVLYNSAGIGSTTVDLIGTNGDVGLGHKSIEGGFSALLQGGISGSGPFYETAASLRQTGLVPATAHSLFFKAHELDGRFSVFLGGMSIPYFAISNGPSYTLFGADVSAFAGQTAELNFSLLREPGLASSDWVLDSIQFSTSVIPEPSVATLAVLGVVVVGWKLLLNCHRPRTTRKRVC